MLSRVSLPKQTCQLPISLTPKCTQMQTKVEIDIFVLLKNGSLRKTNRVHVSEIPFTVSHHRYSNDYRNWMISQACKTYQWDEYWPVLPKIRLYGNKVTNFHSLPMEMQHQQSDWLLLITWQRVIFCNSHCGVLIFFDKSKKGRPMQIIYEWNSFLGKDSLFHLYY